MKKRVTNYRTASDELFLSRYRGHPCEVCCWLYGFDSSTAPERFRQRTVGHHVLPKERYAAMRYEPRNIVVVCPRHHKFDLLCSAHSSSAFAVIGFMRMLEAHRPEDYEFLRSVALGLQEPPPVLTDRQTYLALKGGIL